MRPKDNEKNGLNVDPPILPAESKPVANPDFPSPGSASMGFVLSRLDESRTPEKGEAIHDADRRRIAKELDEEKANQLESYLAGVPRDWRAWAGYGKAHLEASEGLWRDPVPEGEDWRLNFLAQMLLGYSIENYLKALAVYAVPEFLAKKDTPPPHWWNHNIKEMAEDLFVSRPEFRDRFAAIVDLAGRDKKFRKMLERFERSMISVGRYPCPKETLWPIESRDDDTGLFLAIARHRDRPAAFEFIRRITERLGTPEAILDS